jgi:localization factor PodJL
MNSRVSWNVEGVDPAVRERAEAAAKRAGMSLGDWISSQVGDTPPPFKPAQGAAAAALPDRDAHEVAEIHQRLDSIARQIDQISKPAPRNEPTGVARQLNDAISRLDARLSQISEPARMPEPPRGPERVERAAAQVYRDAPPISPGSLDFAIAEITARQNELDAPATRALPQFSAPPIAPKMPPQPTGPDFSGLERQLVKITSQIEALQRPDIEASIAAFRGELAEIRQTITEAMPRRAIESLENEIRSLSRRIDDTRQNGIADNALAGVERALGEIREALRSLTPAEQLAGFDDAIRNLGGKIDMIVRSSDDPGTIQQLEGAIAALRAIVSNVASTEALGRLSEDVHALSSKVDQLARSEGQGDAFAVLEQRIAALTSSLESRERPAATDTSSQLEGALLALSDRLDRMPVGNDGASAFAHLEQRVSYLLERLEATTDPRTGLHLGRVEEGLQDILRHLERQQSTFVALSENRSQAAPTMDPVLVDTIKRELSDMRFNQSETDRHTQDSLEAVHNTLGHVVDRLAMIEGDLRSVKAAPPPAPVVPAMTPPPMQMAPVAPQPRIEMPNPAAAQFDAAPRQFAQAPAAPAVTPEPAAAPKALRDILDQRAARETGPSRMAVDPDLPPDHPLEPGTRPPGRVASPSERIAASESAIGELSPTAREQANTTNFIAAARRAAQAAAAAAKSGDKGKKAGASADPKGTAAPGDKAESTIGSKIRSLLVGASVVVIVLGSFKMAMTFLDGGETTAEAPVQIAPPAPTPAPQLFAPAPTPPQPSMTSPTPIGRQSLNAPPAPTPPPTTIASADTTSALPAMPAPAPQAAPAAPRAPTTIAIPAGEKLPDGIGGPMLRAAALKGDPSAAYEVGVRFAEGKGVPSNYDEAAKWYDRAAQAGVVPAIFRIGTLYEKGLSVTKDLDAARRYYIQAAERGNAKAMHNLAVLEADGGNRGANYKSASQWFRKAAERGVADSQFNLGILFARGIGVEQNLAESFKWFSLAAAQGDADSARKRDDVAKRLDAQSLSAAKLAIQTFTPEAQPDDAVNVAAPAGGWDFANANASAVPPAKPAAAKRAAR